MLLLYIMSGNEKIDYIIKFFERTYTLDAYNKMFDLDTTNGYVSFDEAYQFNYNHINNLMEEDICMLYEIVRTLELNKLSTYTFYYDRNKLLVLLRVLG